jgi:hypothetical protein
MSENTGGEMHPTTRLAEEIEAGGRAAVRMADPRIFSGIMAIMMVAFLGVLLFWQRQDTRDEREGFLAALRENTSAIHELTTAVKEHEKDATARLMSGRGR